MRPFSYLAQCHKTIHHPLPTRLLKINLELVTLDLGDFAVAELLMEDAHADRQVVAALVTEADRGRAAFDDAGGFAGEGAAGEAAPIIDLVLGVAVGALEAAARAA